MFRNNQVGLNARPATFFIQKAYEFKSSIWGEGRAPRQRKSLLGVLSRHLEGNQHHLIAVGPDVGSAVAAPRRDH
jgi:phosphocarrier protein